MCLGTMTFGETWGWGASREVSQRIFEVFVARGGNFFDTSNNYTDGVSEEYLGEFIGRERERFVVATKYSLTERKADPNGGGNSRKNMMQSVHRSLKRLNTEYVDLLYLHMWDFATPVEEVMRGMDDLVRAGKVLYVAFSDTPAWVVSYAIGLAERHGWARPVAYQFPYSVMHRAPEREVIPMARTMDLAMMAWGVLEGGELTGKYNQPGDEPKRSSDASGRAKGAAETLMAMGREIGRTPSQIAINWVRQQRGNVIPIVGARTEAQIVDNLGALDFGLSAEQMAALGGLAEFKVGFPMSFLTSEHVRGLIYGDTFAAIDNHRSIF